MAKKALKVTDVQCSPIDDDDGDGKTTTSLVCVFFFSLSTSSLFLAFEKNKNKTQKSSQLKEEYMKCLAEHDAGADACSAVAKAYLECRMDR